MGIICCIDSRKSEHEMNNFQAEQQITYLKQERKEVFHHRDMNNALNTYIFGVSVHDLTIDDREIDS